ncbi:Smr/MutS family protein [Cecembia lonarensis]|uniref:Recombination and DNA strand exchange inhibitor protein n=1 Tax=Cecembia lonarensis (strain CCUG 58316 / KCTC 22772 / LW9) TaxID=1225176 RepID=K1L2Z8_CECL9|nr:Smr/MutS family protein [Cecembia lonarensis]EKB49181.1 recombination and DNA strand exchange inhibitor protein [Cecembia lonarensis LW9]
MNIGDRVRLLHGNEEGVITKISSGGRVEVEIEDGFRIPALKSEVVVISAVEGQYFGQVEAKESTGIISTATHTGPDEKSVYLCYIPLNDKDHSVYLSNQDERDYLVMASELYGDNRQTIFSEILASKTAKKIAEKSIQNFEEWPPLLLQFFPIHKKIEKSQHSFERKIKFKASAFFKSKGNAPVLNKAGYVFRISESAKEIDIRQLNEELNEKHKVSQPQFQKPPKEIDLHIEKLTKDYEFMSNSEMLMLQMETFDKNLNYAIASGMDEITFIHGIGNGVLRKEIHKYLSQLENIKYFQDTQKSRFGYGATLVRIS